MKIYIGADHNGYDLKEKIENYLIERGYEVVDEGDQKLDPSDDFTVFAGRVVSAMKADKNFEMTRGILICGSGQGMVMSANRHKGIRAGLGFSKESARSVRNDEDSNVLALPAEILSNTKKWQKIIDTWLTTPFAGAMRYKRRIRQLDEI
jgi:ribose 5-phosphate isomerase B